MNKEKGGIHLGIILVAVLVIGGGIVFLSSGKKGDGDSKEAKKEGNVKVQDEDKYSGWEEYTNDELGISFKYPSDWEFSINTQREGFFSCNLHLDDTSQPKIEIYTEEMTPSYSIGITVEDNKKGMSAREYHLDMFGDSSKKREEERISNVSYSGVDGIEYLEAMAPSSGSGYGVLLSDGDRLYRFVHSALATKDTHEKYLSTYKDILDTVVIK